MENAIYHMERENGAAFGADAFSSEKERKKLAGVRITDGCIGCGMCYGICSFSAVYRDGERFRIDEDRCGKCGVCYANCPAEAIVCRYASITN